MGAAGGCDCRMSSSCHFYSRLALVISGLSECMGLARCHRRLQLPFGWDNQHCWTVSAGCRGSSLSRGEPGVKEGRPYQAALSAENAHTSVVEYLERGK